MAKALNDKDRPEPWFGKKGKPAPAPKQTRAASKKMTEEQNKEDNVVEEPSTRGRGRQKAKAKEPAPAKGKKKVNSLQTGAAQVVLGLTKSPVPNPEELRRKREQDALACGRVVKIVTKPSKRQSCPTILPHDSSEKLPVAELATGDDGKDCHSPSTLQLIHLSPGMKTKRLSIRCIFSQGNV
jgi:hypothetical protein